MPGEKIQEDMKEFDRCLYTSSIVAGKGMRGGKTGAKNN
jgi:hypothetical protein